MKQPKPILVIKQKCGECQGWKLINEVDLDLKHHIKAYRPSQICKSCKGTGEQEIKIAPLRGFEKCGNIIHIYPVKEVNKEIVDSGIRILNNCNLCNNTGYIIPKEYE